MSVPFSNLGNPKPSPEVSAGPTHSMLGPNGDLLADVPIVDRLNRLQALLAEWLRMENVVVLLGAGASVSQGGPLMDGLETFVLEAARDICGVDADLKDCKEIVHARLQGDGESKYLFEQWLSFISNATHIAGSANSPIESFCIRGKSDAGKPTALTIDTEKLNKFLNLLSRLIYLRCSLRLPPITDKPTGHHAFVAKLVARDPSLGRAHVFTTNYDTLLEQALDDLGIQYSDGFVGSVGRRFDPSIYGLDIYYPGEIGEGRVRRFDKFIHLYKPHGSIHWRRRSEGQVVQTLDHQLGIWEEWQEKDVAEKNKALLAVFHQDSDPIGILPTENKFVQTLGMPYAHIFRSLHQRLQTPQTLLLICGYSFSDAHLNAIIDDAMTNPSLVLLVVSPFPDETIGKRVEKYQLAGERAFFLHGINSSDGPPEHGTFDDFALRLLPHVRWIEDYRKLRAVENALRDVSPTFRGTENR